ncbi:MAG: cell division protein FtsA [bacterium]|nr:cell division protein FtsA [bacterium]
MGKVFTERIITSIDVGTSKICVLIAHQLEGQRFEVVGIGKARSDGLRKGVVVDIAKTIHSIKQAVKEAEMMAGVSVESAYIGISGGHIISKNSHGVVPIKRGQVRTSDIVNALAAARAIPVEKDHQILHVLPQYFVIDSHEKVADPIDMHGIRLEVQAHIIMGAISSVQNLINCCQQAGVYVADIILEQLASADAVLSKDEQELGVAVLDIGGGTSDFAIYQQGSIRHTMVLPIAGNHFTNDIAIGLRTTIEDAECIKKEHGLATLDVLEKNELIEIEMVQGADRQVIHVSDLVRIIQPRAQELLTLVHDEIITHKLQSFISTGLVLTGGGSLLTGMQELAEQIFQVPVRIGQPRIEFAMPESLNSPIYATGYGLLVHALKQKQQTTSAQTSDGIHKRVFERMKSWVADFF